MSNPKLHAHPQLFSVYAPLYRWTLVYRARECKRWKPCIVLFVAVQTVCCKPARHHTLFILPGCVCAGCRSSLGWPTHCCCFTDICYLSWTAMCSTVLRHTQVYVYVYSRAGVKTVKIAWYSWTYSITGVILSYFLYVCIFHSHFSKDSTVQRSRSLAYLILFVIAY